MNGDVMEKVKSIIENHTYFRYDEKSQCFENEIFPCYDDSISTDSIKEIMESDDPETAFNEWLDAVYFDEEQRLKDEAIQQLHSYWDDNDGANLDEIEQEFDENSYVLLPEDHYLNQKIHTVITINTGDMNYDFSLNVMMGANFYSSGQFEELSAIAWLLEQQGYSKEMRDFAKRRLPDDKLTPFLQSVRMECDNCCSQMNVLSFICEVTLGDLIKINRVKSMREANDTFNMPYHPAEREYTDELIIPKKCFCGLFNPWNGGGSMFEIKLEKDVHLPLKYVETILPDGMRDRYGVQDVYGFVGKAWDTEIKFEEVK